MDKFIVVDYQEGASGEFVARFISAHFGHDLEFDQQAHPSHIQKWLNSHSLVKQDWNINFQSYFHTFLNRCATQEITNIAVPYHLYKWPRHVKIILNQLPQTQFVKINCESHYEQVNAEFRRKVLDRQLTDFQELQFLLANQGRDFVKDMLKLYQQKKLFYRDIFPGVSPQPRTLPSSDIEIRYNDFFCDFNQTATAYEKLCSQLKLMPDTLLLTALLERNKKNYQDLNNYLRTL